MCSKSQSVPLSIPGPLVEFILLGPQDDRRQLQDSPILGDVWIEFGKRPSEPLDLLIAPFRGQHAGVVATAIHENLTRRDRADPSVSYLQGLVVARLTFEEVLRVIVPRTKWWADKKGLGETTKRTRKPGKAKSKSTEGESHALESYTTEKIQGVLAKIMTAVEEWYSKTGIQRARELEPFDRFVSLAALLLWARNQAVPGDGKVAAQSMQHVEFLLRHANLQDMAERIAALGEVMLAQPAEEPLIWQVSVNREAMPAISRSVPAVKADAATTLFKVDCSEIAWAVLDSGIEGDHPAFLTRDRTESRVRRSFDFKNFRRIVSLSNLQDDTRAANVAELKKDAKSLVHKLDDPDRDLKKLAENARDRGPIHWELVEKFVEIRTNTPPGTNHGTHVAGILGANRASAEQAGQSDEVANGMCPDISLYDFRVIGPAIRDTEFAIIAALQFIRYLNDRDNFLAIHGANLSLSIPHDVRNFACGRTPICNECERVVESGVVVVTAAGNHGYKSFETKDGSYDSFTAFSITDPGNADSVITVGATHRFWPHTYGVSFFSSRGPTGDGRVKPDLVAPGERIRAPFPGGNWGDLDGTSMAAPHVSGAAAMLMARYSELIGQPRRIKQILCESATDLGRERTFQGHGMLDVLRAFQSI